MGVLGIEPTFETGTRLDRLMFFGHPQPCFSRKGSPIKVSLKDGLGQTDDASVRTRGLIPLEGFHFQSAATIARIATQNIIQAQMSMLKLSRVLAGWLLAAAVCACLAGTSMAQVAVRSVKVLGSKDTVEIEVEASDRIVPESQVLTGPDRLVIDFPNALPGNQVRSQSVDRGEVKDVRVGLFQAKPPVTRVVVDLKSARSYQIFPYGRTVMIKVTGDAASSASAATTNDAQPTRRPGLVTTNYTTRIEPVSVPPQTPLQVSYRDGLLGIHSNKATLSEVLYAIQQRTGADISIPAGAEQEKVIAEINPAPAAEALARLLNGSRFNFLILNSATDPRQLDRVILSARTVGEYVPPPPQPAVEEQDGTVEEPPVPTPNPPEQVPNPENAPAPPGAGESPQGQ